MENYTSVSPEIKAAEGQNYKLYEQDTHAKAQLRELQQYLGRAARSSLSSNGNSAGESAKTETKPSRRRAGRFINPERFEKGDDQSQEIQGIGEREQRAIDAMRKFIWNNLIDAAAQHRQLEKSRIDNELALRVMEDEAGDFSNRNSVIDSQVELIGAIDERRKELANQTPESYTLVHGLELRKHSRQVKAGELATTPYVEDHMNRVQDNIRQGRPTFLHGHLGSGKTELAINAARQAAIDRAAYEEALKDNDIFIDSHPEASADECTAELGKAYRRHLMTFEKALRDGDQSAQDRFAPLVISGSKDLTSQDLYADKTLKLSTVFNGKTLNEHLAKFEEEMVDWRRQHPNAADNEETKAREELFELYKTKVAGFGTEVQTVEQAVLRGINEGRPVVIDEINAIPSAILISLNDVLQRRAGEKCFIPGVGDVEIKPGFAIIMTGNLSSNKINYHGTEELNPAFLSRLDVIEHDYLPMSENGNIEDQDDPIKNELFHVIVSYLADEKGNLRLPEMDKSLDKLFALCQLAHETQGIFEGKRRSAITMDSGEEIEADFEKSVLSVRNLLNVLEVWRKGRNEDLDKALFDGFIAGITKADDQNLMLALARKYGFFSREDGYQIKIKERGAGFTTWDEIHPGEYHFKSSPLETLSVRKVVELLYGPGPEREIYPEDIDLDEAVNQVEDDEVTVEDLGGFEDQLKGFGQIISALEELGRRCGCRIDNANPSGTGKE